MVNQILFIIAVVFVLGLISFLGIRVMISTRKAREKKKTIAPSIVYNKDFIIRANNCSYCGDLSWTVKEYGFQLHKQNCPSRNFHQGNRPNKK